MSAGIGLRLQNKVAFITGATSGIGAVMVRRFAEQAAKGGLSALTRQIAFDYGPHNIRANAIITGLIVHEGSQRQVDTPEKYNAYRARHLTRLGVPDDISNAAIYLASDESEFVTGSHINVEGGVLVKSRPDAVLIRDVAVN